MKRNTSLWAISVCAALLVGLTAQPAASIPLQVRGIDSGLLTTSPTLSIADLPPLADLQEFRVFYAADAADGETMDYNGAVPILESDLVDDAAHLFVLEKSGELALFVVYKRQAGTQSADGVLSATGGDFSSADIIVKDALGDSYSIASGDIVTSHRITLSGRTDGYVATLAGKFDAEGDTLGFDFATPASGTSDLPLTSIQVFAGIDQSGGPIWFEIDSGPFSSTTPRRVELTIPPAVPSLGSPAMAVLALALALLGVAGMSAISSRPAE
jgi:hypothetical protein